MKKLVAVMLMSAAVLAGPTAPANAASDEEVANCLIFPALKKECWELGAEMAAAGPMAVAAAADDAAEEVNLPVMWWNCTRAPEGSGHLFDC